jgi:hypothetical protein
MKSPVRKREQVAVGIVVMEKSVSQNMKNHAGKECSQPRGTETIRQHEP